MASICKIDTPENAAYHEIHNIKRLIEANMRDPRFFKTSYISNDSKRLELLWREEIPKRTKQHAGFYLVQKREHFGPEIAKNILAIVAEETTYNKTGFELILEVIECKCHNKEAKDTCLCKKFFMSRSNAIDLMNNNIWIVFNLFFNYLIFPVYCTDLEMMRNYYEEDEMPYVSVPEINLNLLKIHLLYKTLTEVTAIIRGRHYGICYRQYTLFQETVDIVLKELSGYLDLPYSSPFTNTSTGSQVKSHESIPIMQRHIITRREVYDGTDVTTVSSRFSRPTYPAIPSMGIWSRFFLPNQRLSPSDIPGWYSDPDPNQLTPAMLKLAQRRHVQQTTQLPSTILKEEEEQIELSLKSNELISHTSTTQPSSSSTPVPLSQTETSSSSSSSSSETSQNKSKCCICISETPTFVLIPCGHICLCHNCKDTLLNKCPLCTAPIERILQTFQ